MKVEERYIDYQGYKTWSICYGELTDTTTPLIVLHGGPGYPHYHMQNLSELAVAGQPVIMYDQLGCGLSDRPDNPSLWTVELFVHELEAVRIAWSVQRMHILGHSWGGSLAAEYALAYPEHVDKLILSSPLLDTQLWVREADALKDNLSPDIAETMRRHEQAGTTDTEEYASAYKVFTQSFLCRLPEYPEQLRQSDEGFGEQVYTTMWGPSEAYANGTLKDWSVMKRLRDIDAPVLFMSGKYDEATPHQIECAREYLPTSSWEFFANSSHTANLEEPDRYLTAVKHFLLKP